MTRNNIVTFFATATALLLSTQAVMANPSVGKPLRGLPPLQRKLGECTEDYCHNGGTCALVSKENGTKTEPECTCTPGYHGAHCLNSVCADFDCNNGGSCQVKSETDADGKVTYVPHCKCAELFHGEHCDAVDDVCEGYCENDGTCALVSKENGTKTEPECTCKPGYHGAHCRNSVCADFDCNNGGSCHVKNKMDADGNVKYVAHCKCAELFHGKHCDAVDDVCEGFPCENDGVCESELITMPDNSSYFKPECACPHAYHGKHCQSRTAVCDLACEHGSKCKIDQRKNEPYCDCGTLDWDGELCGTPIVACGPSIYCHNGGTCRSPTDPNGNPDDGYWCDCKTADFKGHKWEGPHCHDMIEEASSSGHSDGAVAGIAIASITGAAIVAFAVSKYIRFRRAKTLPDDLVMKTYEDNRMASGDRAGITIEVLGDDKEIA